MNEVDLIGNHFCSYAPCMTDVRAPTATPSDRNFEMASIADARAVLIEKGRASAFIMAASGLELRWYAPCGEDLQTPHDQDELYFIASGSSWFVRQTSRVRCHEGDVIFVPAGEYHRFEEFDDGFGVWVIFFGAKHDFEILQKKNSEER